MLTVNATSTDVGDIVVGLGGAGVLVASDGSVTQSQGRLEVGGEAYGSATANGTVTLEGGSKWTEAGQAVIGTYGTGSLTIESGSTFESGVGNSPTGTSGLIGAYAGGTACDAATGATGCVTVDGAGSQWTNDGALRVGGEPDTTNKVNAGTGLLTISNGGAVVDTAVNADGVAASVGWKAGSAGFVTVESGSTWTNNGDLVVGDGGDGTVNLMQASTVSVTGFTTVGGAGAGSFFNDGSTHTTQDLVIGQQSGSTGLYKLTDGGGLTVGSALDTGFMDVGESGKGTFTQADAASSTTVYGSLDVGRYSDGNGTVNLEGGKLTVNGFATVGDSGTGAFNQSGGSTVTIGDAGLAIGRGLGYGPTPSGMGTGTYSLADTSTLNVTGGITLGGNVGAKGTFIQSGGAVNADNEYVGAAGVGDWNQSSGANTTTQLSIGNNTGGTGTYELSGAAILNGGAEYVGSAGNGTLTQWGGTNNATYLSIGNDAGGSGLYTMSAGTLSNTGDTYLGGVSTAVGAFTQTGGSASLSGDVNVGYKSAATSTLSLGGSGALAIGGNLDIGVKSGASGAFDYNTAAGDKASLTFTGSGQTLTVGDAGAGVFKQGGGDLNLASQGVTLTIGNQAGSQGAFTVTGGTLEAAAVNVGVAGKGSFGVANVTATVGDLSVGSLGAVSVSGSTFTATGETTNNGAITVSDSTVTWTGTFTDNGAYKSDPSTQTFKGDLDIGATGYLVGGAGDVFIVDGSLDNASTQKTLWSTNDATLEFAGAGVHDFTTTGVAGAGFLDNFAWGTLDLSAGSLDLSGVLYVGALDGLDISGTQISNISGAGTIYYDASLNPYLGGQTFSFAGGGELIAVGGSSPVPEPSTWAMLLVGFGGLGFAAARKARARRPVAA